MMLKKLQELNNLISTPSSSRRQMILNDMVFLKSKGVNCHQCRGPCCTYESNSMQITILESLDIINFLISENRISPDLFIQLNETITKYRLDQIMGTGKNSIRKTYTCPFFENEAKGCSISRNSKPIGCLGFNPIEQNITNGGSCKSDLPLLQKRETEFHQDENKINIILKKELNIFWEKAPIPVAILEVLIALEN